MSNTPYLPFPIELLRTPEHNQLMATCGIDPKTFENYVVESSTAFKEKLTKDGIDLDTLSEMEHTLRLSGFVLGQFFESL